MAKATSSYDLLHQVGMLFDAGTVTGLSDAQLLERFTAQSAVAHDSHLAAEAAFAALISRHGPMVLGVCRRALADPAEVEDAFQATFLVLVRRAGSVRVEDSLGRWLYGVSRRVAAKARARAERSRTRSVPLAVEPVAGPSTEDEIEALAALDEEVGRLPEKYRAPVVLCHLEGLSHAEAATRLRWPVGTVSGRLSRARGLLKQRLVRRGLSPTGGALAILAASERARAAVPEPLTVATARAAARMAMGGAPQAGVASASVLSLLNEVLRAAAAVKLKAAAAVLLALVFAGATASAVGLGLDDGGRGRTPADVRNLAREPAVASPTGEGRSADDLVEAIEVLLKTARRPLSTEAWNRTHGEIAALVDALRTAYPADLRGARYMPSRWRSLCLIDRMPQASAEVHAVLTTTRDPVLRRDALYFDTLFRIREPLDGLAAASMAEAFARQAPGDNRAGEVLFQASRKLDDDWMAREVLVVALAAACALIAINRRGWRRVARVAFAVLVLVTILLCGFKLLASDVLTVCTDALYKWLNDPATLVKERGIAAWYASQVLGNLRIAGSNLRTGLAVAVAIAGAIALSRVVARRRSVATPGRRPTAVRPGILAFLGILILCCLADGGFIAYRRSTLREHILRGYPDSFRGRLVQGERRQRDRVGEPFELDFTDAITGRHVSMRDLRGKVVVVDFWATWCGPCVSEVPEMIRLYQEYHDRGVEFIGVSLDTAEEDGGLEALKAFVAKEQIPWPQYYQGKSWAPDAAAGTAMDTVSELWGIEMIPTVFLIDAEGRLDSTQARGHLATLIPRLLERRDRSPNGR